MTNLNDRLKMWRLSILMLVSFL